MSRDMGLHGLDLKHIQKFSIASRCLWWHGSVAGQRRSAL